MYRYIIFADEPLIVKTKYRTASLLTRRKLCDKINYYHDEWNHTAPLRTFRLVLKSNRSIREPINVEAITCPMLTGHYYIREGLSNSKKCILILDCLRKPIFDYIFKSKCKTIFISEEYCG